MVVYKYKRRDALSVNRGWRLVIQLEESRSLSRIHSYVSAVWFFFVHYGEQTLLCIAGLREIKAKL